MFNQPIINSVIKLAIFSIFLYGLGCILFTDFDVEKFTALFFLCILNFIFYFSFKNK